MPSTANYEEALKQFAMRGEYDGIEGMEQMIYKVDNRENCKCCQGMVNNCQGKMCKELGICYCMVADEEDI